MTTTAANSAAFDAKYVSTNIRPGAPLYSKKLIDGYRERLVALGGKDWDEYNYAILVRYSP